MSTAIAREAKKKQREPDDRLLREIRESVTIGGENGSSSTSPSAPRRTNSDNQHQTTSPSSKALPSRTGNNPFADSSAAAGASSGRPKESESARARRKAKEAAEEKKKKASKHADVIDKLDPSGFWGTGMLHHESAYDAAAPSRNKSSHAAPMRAFDPNAADPSQQGSSSSSAAAAAANGTRRPSPLSGDSYKDGGGGGVTFEDSSKVATPTGDMVDSIDYLSGPGLTKSKTLKKTRSRSGDNGPSTSSSSGKDRDIPIPAEEDYINARAKDQKNALANAWGIADPEPFEDFGMSAASSAPRGETGLASATSSIWKGYEGHGGSTSGSRGAAQVELGKPISSEMTEEMLDEPIAWTNRPAVTRKESGGGGAGVKRTKSLMQRIRNMRENPNVPLPTDDGVTTPNGTPTYSQTQNQNPAFPSPTGQQQQQDSRSRSPLPPPSSSSAADDSTRQAMGHRSTSSQSAHTNKRLPPPPPASSSPAAAASSATPVFDPFADDPAQNYYAPPQSSTASKPSTTTAQNGSSSSSNPYSSTLSAPSSSHHPSSSAARGGAARSPRSPVPPPAPIDLPGSGGYFPRVTLGSGEDSFEELSGGFNGGGGRKGSGSAGGGGGLGRKPSLMKRLMGKAGGSSS